MGVGGAGDLRPQAICHTRFSATNIVASIDRYCAWSTSTSEVERGFFVTSSINDGSSDDFHCGRENEILTLVCDCQEPTARAVLIKETRRGWNQHWGESRTSNTRRVDKGRSSRPGEYGAGEAAFIRLRRDAALAVAKAPVGALQHVVDLDFIHLAERQHEDLTFLPSNCNATECHDLAGRAQRSGGREP